MSLPDGHTKESLLVLLEQTKREVGLENIREQVIRLQEHVEEWFNDAMDRVSGWYKRWTQVMLLCIAGILVVSANADTFSFANRLMRDSALRASIVNAVEVTITDSPAPGSDAAAKATFLEEARKLVLPLGWAEAPQSAYRDEQIPSDLGGWFTKILGLLITVFAVSLGAPFWFDTLSKFVNIRGAGIPPGEAKKSAPQTAKAALVIERS